VNFITEILKRPHKINPDALAKIGNFKMPKITAIGEPTAMHRALESAEGVRQFKDAVADFGLGYQETVERNVTVRAYDGSSDLRSAEATE